MKRKALIVQGGWEGHQPKEVAEIFRKTLVECDFDVEVSDTLDSFADLEKLRTLHLIIPIWTMGTITFQQLISVIQAVSEGVGLAGCHGGMCDAFRESTDWQFMTGGQWVAHPGNDGTEHVINIKRGSSPIVDGIEDFTVKTEQYYMHVDPAIEVLATTTFPVADGLHVPNGKVDVPVVWTKRWGKGRVFYNSLGHQANVFDMKEPLLLMKRGFLWAAEGRDIALAENNDK